MNTTTNAVNATVRTRRIEHTNYFVVDKFGEGQTVAEYPSLKDAIDAARNINRLTGHRTAVYLGDISVTNFGGTE